MSWRNLLASIFGDFCGGSNCPGVTPTIPAKKADAREFQDCYCARIGFCWAPSSRMIDRISPTIRNEPVTRIQPRPRDKTKAENLIADPWAMSALSDFIYPETTGARPKNLEERLNFQKGLGRLAARDAAVFELLMDVRNLLKPLTVLDDPSIVGRIENEVASELSLSSAAQVTQFAKAA